MAHPVMGVSAQAGLGTSPPGPALAAGSNDTAGRVTFGSGTSIPGTGPYLLLRLQFAGSWTSGLDNQTGVLQNPIVHPQPENAATAALGPFFVVPPTSGNPGTGCAVDIYCTVAPAASQGGSTYQLGYTVANGV